MEFLGMLGVMLASLEVDYGDRFLVSGVLLKTCTPPIPKNLSLISIFVCP